MVPEGTIQAKDLTGQALPDATVNIIDLETGAIIATTTPMLTATTRSLSLPAVPIF